MKKISLLLMIVIVFSSCKNKVATPETLSESRVEQLPYYREASFTPYWNLSNEELKKWHQIPDFLLINQLGDTITEQNLHGKIYVADFFFTTCPGICPKMTANLALIQEEFINDDDVFLLSHSVTPNMDSVEVLKTYADLYEVDSDKWFLLTGNRHEIYDLGRKAYFVEEDLGVEKSKDDFLHTENFVLIDKNKHIRGIYNGLNKTAVQQLISDINLLKEEKY